MLSSLLWPEYRLAGMPERWQELTRPVSFFDDLPDVVAQKGRIERLSEGGEEQGLFVGIDQKPQPALLGVAQEAF